jgi:hypothetical protein
MLTCKKVQQPAMDGTHSAGMKSLKLYRSRTRYPCLQLPVFPEETAVTTGLSIELLLLLLLANGKKQGGSMMGQRWRENEVKQGQAGSSLS